MIARSAAIGAVLGLAASVFFAFGAGWRAPFYSDDYGFLAQLAEHGWRTSLTIPWGDHFDPGYRLLVAAEAAAFGRNTSGYHIVSMLLHWLNALFVYVFVSRLTGRHAGIAAAVTFALSPMGAQTVVQINCTSYLTAMLSTLLVACALIEHEPVAGRARVCRSTRRHALAAAVAFIGLTCHGATWMALPTVLILGWTTIDRRPLGRAMLGLAIAGGMFVVLRLVAARPALQHMGPIAHMAPTASLPLHRQSLEIAPLLAILATQVVARFGAVFAPDPALGILRGYAATGAALLLLAQGVTALAVSRVAWAGAALFVASWLGSFLRRPQMLLVLASTDRYWYFAQLGLALFVGAASAAVPRHWWRWTTIAALLVALTRAIPSIHATTERFITEGRHFAGVVEDYERTMQTFLTDVPAGSPLVFEDGFLEHSPAGIFVHKRQIFRLLFPSRPEVGFAWPGESAATHVWNSTTVEPYPNVLQRRWPRIRGAWRTPHGPSEPSSSAAPPNR